MPQAGQIIRALDFPAEDSAVGGNTISDISATTPTLGSPVVAVTVIAPTSGKLKIEVSGGGRDNGGTNRVFFEPLVRMDDENGADVVQGSISTDTGYGTSDTADDAMYGGGGMWVLPGLTPGQAYWVAVTYRVSGGSTADVYRRNVYAGPAN